MIINETTPDAHFRDGVIRDTVKWYDGCGGDADASSDAFCALGGALQIQVQQPGRWPYLFIGSRCPAVQLWGDEFADSAIGSNGIPDSDVEAFFQSDYEAVLKSGKTISQTAVGTVQVRGQPIIVDYMRFVFPIRFHSFRAVGILARFLAPPTPPN